MQKTFASFNLGSLVEDLLGLAQNLRAAGAPRATHEFEKILKKMNVVTRAEFDAVKAIAIAARTQAEEVAEHVGMKKKAARKPAAKKPAPNKAPAKKPAAKAAKKAVRKK